MNCKLLAKELIKVAHILIGMEFDTQEAMDAYLKEHPDADKSNHSVKKTDEKPSDDKKPNKESPEYRKDADEFTKKHNDRPEAKRLGKLPSDKRKVINDIVGSIDKGDDVRDVKKKMDDAVSEGKLSIRNVKDALLLGAGLAEGNSELARKHGIGDYASHKKMADKFNHVLKHVDLITKHLAPQK